MALDETKMRPCKLGTVPALVVVHGKDAGRIKPDEWVRVREREGQPWQRVLVRIVHPNGWFQADR